MASARSEDVQHGSGTWIDYDRPWLFRKYFSAPYAPYFFMSSWSSNLSGRQFLVTQYQASVLSNLVTMALTLAGPRLWILIKAFMMYVYNVFLRYRHIWIRRTVPGAPRFPLSLLSNSQTKCTSLPRLSAASPRNHLPSHTLDLTEDSHSELGAARDLIGDTLTQLMADQIELLADHLSLAKLISKRRICHSFCCKVSKIWTNFLRQPFEVAIRILLSALLIGIFVAESSGSVLSANIVTDTTALASSPRCYAPRYRADTSMRAAAYSQQCYNASLGAEGCNYLYNQSLAYAEESKNGCPWKGGICGLRGSAAISFDTGYVLAKYLGINAPERYLFRRRATYTPLIPDSRFIIERGHGVYYLDIGVIPYDDIISFSTGRFVKSSGMQGRR